MNHVLIVGFGNTIRGDDGLGPLVAASLDKEQFPPDAAVRITCLPLLDIALVAELHEVDLAILVDARQDDNNALLKVDCIEPQKDSPPTPLLSHSSHSMAMSVLLSIVNKWYGQQPSCYLVQPKGFDFSIRDAVSEKAALSAKSARQVIYQLLWAHCHGTIPEAMDDNKPLCSVENAHFE